MIECTFNFNLKVVEMKKHIVLSAAALFLLTSCVTMIRGTTQEVSVNTVPTGAMVQFSNGKSCISPCKIVASRKNSLSITVTKEGYQPHTTTMIPSLSGVGVILGDIVDYGTGAVYDLQPNPYHVYLIEVLEKKELAQK